VDAETTEKNYNNAILEHNKLIDESTEKIKALIDEYQVM